MASPKYVLTMLRMADKDFAAMKLLADADAELIEIFGFHAQQCAEKLIKALLGHLGIKCAKTHDLAELLEPLYRLKAALPSKITQIENLSMFAVEHRYEPLDQSTAPIDKQAIIDALSELRAWVQNQVNSCA